MNCRTCRIVPAKFACKQCKDAFYCSQICAHLDWKQGHFDLCGFGGKRSRDELTIELPKMVCGPNILSMYQGFKTNLGEKTIFLFGEAHSQRNEGYDATQLFLDIAKNYSVDIFLELNFIGRVSTYYRYSSVQLTKMERAFKDCLQGKGCNFENVTVHAIDYRGGYSPLLEDASIEHMARGWLPISLIGEIGRLLLDPNITAEETENIRDALQRVYPNKIDFEEFRLAALFPSENRYMEFVKKTFPMQLVKITVKGSDTSILCERAQKLMRFHQISHNAFRVGLHESMKNGKMTRMAWQIQKLKDIRYSPTQNALQWMLSYIIHLPPPVMDFNRIIWEDLPKIQNIFQINWLEEFLRYQTIFMDLPAIARMLARDAPVVLAYMGYNHVYDWNNYLQWTPDPTNDPFKFPWKSVKTFAAPDANSCLEIPEEMREFLN